MAVLGVQLSASISVHPQQRRAARRSAIRPSRPSRTVTCAAQDAAGPSASSSTVPWGFGFQMNERFLQWDDAAAAQLIKLHIAGKLHLSVEEVEERLQQLARLVPDMVDKLPRMRADIVLALVQDPAATTLHLLGLRDLLPGVNISALVTRWPFIITEFDLPALEARLADMRRLLPGVRVEALVDLEPQLLKADLAVVLANIQRILPGRNPVDVLVAQPQMVLDMQQAGMSSALDVEGFTTPTTVTATTTTPAQKA